MKIAVWARSGIGGTEKAATLFAAALARKGHSVDYLSPPDARSAILQSAGVRTLDIHSDERALRSYIEESLPDVVHQYVPGYRFDGPLYRIWDSITGPKPKLIESNVFGWWDDQESRRLVAFRCFISMSCAAKCFQRHGVKMTPERLERQTAVYFPVQEEPLHIDFDRDAFRRELGVSEGELLAVRIGQVSAKWRLWECEAFAQARRKAPHIRLLLMQPRNDVWQAVESGRFGPGIILRRITSDFVWLRRLYLAADMSIHATTTGESFGYTLAEAMAAELPLIVRSTPWEDNAQAELIETNTSGFVCGSVGEMARRWVDLALDAQLRKRIGTAARKRILTLSQPETETDVLEAAMRFAVTGERSEILDVRNRDLMAFTRDFPRREWRLSESPWSHPVDHLSARIYSRYRSLRTWGRMAAFRHGLRTHP